MERKRGRRGKREEGKNKEKGERGKREKGRGRGKDYM